MYDMIDKVMEGYVRLCKDVRRWRLATVSNEVVGRTDYGWVNE